MTDPSQQPESYAQLYKKKGAEEERGRIIELVKKVIGDKADEFNKTETLLTCAVLVNLKIDLLHLISNEK